MPVRSGIRSGRFEPSIMLSAESAWRIAGAPTGAPSNLSCRICAAQVEIINDTHEISRKRTQNFIISPILAKLCALSRSTRLFRSNRRRWEFMSVAEGVSEVGERWRYLQTFCPPSEQERRYPISQACQAKIPPAHARRLNRRGVSQAWPSSL